MPNFENASVDYNAREKKIHEQYPTVEKILEEFEVLEKDKISEFAGGIVHQMEFVPNTNNKVAVVSFEKHDLGAGNRVYTEFSVEVLIKAKGKDIGIMNNNRNVSHENPLKVSNIKLVDTHVEYQIESKGKVENEQSMDLYSVLHLADSKK